MATIKSALQAAAREIERRDAEYLLSHVLQRPRAWLFAHDSDRLSPEHEAQFDLIAASRAMGMPVAYLTGMREFYGREFAVSPDVLIPRPETEVLVDRALARLSGRTSRADVLDLGTGSGAIAITLALESTARMTALDQSEAALRVARDNAARLAASVEFLASDWYTALGARRFDLIIANPPYVAAGDAHLGQGDLRFEPGAALSDGSGDGLASIRAIVSGAAEHLNPGGWLQFEHGYDQARACSELLAQAGFETLESSADLAGIPRVAGGRRPVL